MKLLSSLASVTFVAALTGCGSSAPTCGPTATSFRICDQDSVYECPVASQAQLDAEDERNAQCDGKSGGDLAECLANLPEGEQLEMTLVASCADGGQVCVADAAGQGASCEDAN